MVVNHVMLIRWHEPLTGPLCRRCAQPIDRSDRFGVSERVCGPCRGAARGALTQAGSAPS